MLRIICICDTCLESFEQVLDHGLKTVTYEVAFTCSGCQLEKARKTKEPQHIKDLVAMRREESPSS